MQAEGIKQSPRMVITPRQVQDNSEEISTLKAELATLKDEVGSSSALMQLHPPFPIHAVLAFTRTAFCTHCKCRQSWYCNEDV